MAPRGEPDIAQRAAQARRDPPGKDVLALDAAPLEDLQRHVDLPAAGVFWGGALILGSISATTLRGRRPAGAAALADGAHHLTAVLGGLDGDLHPHREVDPDGCQAATGPDHRGLGLQQVLRGLDEDGVADDLPDRLLELVFIARQDASVDAGRGLPRDPLSACFWAFAAYKAPLPQDRTG